MGFSSEFPYKFDDSVKFKNTYKPTLIKSVEHFKEITDDISGKIVAGDTETDGLNADIHHVVGFSFSTSSYNGYYIPLRHNLGNIVESEEELNKFFPILFDFIYRNNWLFYNWVFDAQMLRKDGLIVSDVRVQDVLAYVFNSDTNIKANNLKWAAEQYLNRKSPTYAETVGGKEISFDMLLPEEAYDYACQDTANTYALFLFFNKTLLPVCKKVLKIDCNLVKAVADYYAPNKITIDNDLMFNVGMELRERRDEIERKLLKLMGRSVLNAINLNSPDQVSEVLQEMGISTKVFSEKTGKMSVDRASLEKLDNPVAELLIEHGSLSTQISTYADKLSKVSSGRMNIKLFTASTGRTAIGDDRDSKSSSESFYMPFNFQNMTKPNTSLFRKEFIGDAPQNENLVLGYRFTELKNGEEKGLDPIEIVEGMGGNYNIRKAITVPERNKKDWYFASLDYVAEELRIIGGLSKDPVYLKAFLEDKDIYKTVGSSMFGVAYDDITKNQRKKAKICVLGLNYGGSYMTIMRNGKISEDEAKETEKIYWNSVPVLREWKREMVDRASSEYFVEMTYEDYLNKENKEMSDILKIAKRVPYMTRSAYGRIRWLGSFLGSPKRSMRKYGIRSVVSHIVQGTAADVMREVLYDLYKEVFIKYEKYIKFSGCIHDEIDVCIRKDSLELLDLVKSIMTKRPPGCAIDLTVGTEIGYSYGFLFPFQKDNNGVWICK